MHYLVTGHTGFKGAWLVLLLKKLGHRVSGIALEPDEGSLFVSAHLTDLLDHDLRIDIRDSAQLASAIREAEPDVVIHLAAQALVRESYNSPRFTFETNVMGTFNVLEASSVVPSVKAILIVTTDKVYRNLNQVEGYLESDPLGGDDPYSSSKAMADLLTQSWLKSYPGPPTAIARAGNVIGGGDASKDRLIVDLVRSFLAREKTQIRFADAVRPWQHVLDCLAGYLAIVTDLLGDPNETVWNIGPLESSFISVGKMADESVKYWSDGSNWTRDVRPHPHEAQLLMLNSQKARDVLGWRDYVPYPESLHWTLDWYKLAGSGSDTRDLMRDQIDRFLTLSGQKDGTAVGLIDF